MTSEFSQTLEYYFHVQKKSFQMFQVYTKISSFLPAHSQPIMELCDDLNK